MAATLRIGLRQPRIVLSLGTVGSSVATQLGIPGPTGAAGPQGPAGPPGAAATWRGAYSAATVYAAGDAVEFGGVPYVTAAAVGPGVAPPTSPWALITGAEGPQGPAGPAGPAGAAGPTGPTGATGAQGPQGVIPFSGPSVGTLQGFWVGSTQPPDNTWIWIVTDVPVGGPASVSAVAALLGMSAIPPGVQSVGSPINIAAAAVAMGLAAVVPTVQAQGGAAQITAAVALVPVALTAPVVSQRSALIPANDEFDTDITATTEQSGAWWKTESAGFGDNIPGEALAGRLASVEMSGSYVGRLRARAGDDTTLGTTPSYAQLLYKFMKADVDATSAVITLDVRVKAVGAAASSAALLIAATDSGGAAVNDVTNYRGTIMLWGTPPGNADNTTLVIASPVANTTYAGKTFNLKSWIEARLAVGKTWADVFKVVLAFQVYDGAGVATEFYIDNFR